MEPHLLVSFLKEQHTDAKFIDRLKITYRPLICPFDHLLKIVNKEDRIFDIGCGSGQFAMLLAEFARPRSIYGVEISQELINNAYSLISKYPEVESKFEVYNGTVLPKNILYATKIFMIDVLHHIPKENQLLFLKNLYNQMHEGAQFVLKDIDADNPRVVFNKLHDLLFSHEIGNEIAYSKAIKILKDIGFRIKSSVKKTLYVYPHYTIIAEK
jgi:cyclopropane fatty-acyl-phospholipid synthase-like methyltransferase